MPRQRHKKIYAVTALLLTSLNNDKHRHCQRSLFPKSSHVRNDFLLFLPCFALSPKCPRDRAAGHNDILPRSWHNVLLPRVFCLMRVSEFFFIWFVLVFPSSVIRGTIVLSVIGLLALSFHFTVLPFAVPSSNRAVPRRVPFAETHEPRCDVPAENQDDIDWWFRQPESPDPAMASCPLPRLSYADADGKLHLLPQCINPAVSISRAGDTRPFLTGSERITGQEIQNVHCSVEGLGRFSMEHFGFSMQSPRVSSALDRVRKRIHGGQTLKPSFPVNVILVLSDATSGLHFRRSCPKTMSFLRSQPDSEMFEFTRYHVLGYHTIQNAVPLFFGHDCGGLGTRFHLHFYDSPSFDANITKTHFLSPYFKQFGYVTTTLAQHCLETTSDNPYTGMLHYPLPQECGKLLHQLYGNETTEFIDVPQPPHHSCLWWGRMRNPPSFLRSLDSSQCDYVDTSLEYFTDMIRQLPSDMLYFHYLYLLLGHFSVRPMYLSSLDAPLVQMLSRVDFKQSIFVFMADHGLHFGPFLETAQGQVEYKLPPLIMSLPRWLLNEHPEIRQHLYENQDMLVTHWDLHHTLKHLVTYPATPRDLPFVKSYSLFGHIPGRTCAEAGIPGEFCLCDPWKPYPLAKWAVDADLMHDIDHGLDVKVNAPLRQARNEMPPFDSPCVHVIRGRIQSVDMSTALLSDGRLFRIPTYYFRVLLNVQPTDALFEMILHRQLPPEQLKSEETRFAYLRKFREPEFAPNSTISSLRRISPLHEEERQARRPARFSVELCVVPSSSSTSATSLSAVSASST